jgi:hypothetical protein
VDKCEENIKTAGKRESNNSIPAPSTVEYLSKRQQPVVLLLLVSHPVESLFVHQHPGT